MRCACNQITSGAFGWSSQSEAIVLKARFTASTAVHLRETPLSSDQVMTDESINQTTAAHVLVIASVQQTQQLVWWLLGFGDAVEVLEPLALRVQIKETAERMALQYI